MDFDAAGNEDANVVEQPAMTSAPRSWSTNVYPLFSSACSCCHGASGGLTLSPIGTAYRELVNVVSSADGGCSPLMRVAPSDSAASHLFKKLEGTQTCGWRMPDGGPYFNAANLDTVRDWIDEGTSDN